MRSIRHSLFALLAISSAAASVLATPSDARAAAVELYVQTPYDFRTGDFDLNHLETANGEPIFRQGLHIPYDDIEQAGRAALAELTKTPLQGTATCGDGILDPFCPDAHWHVSFTAGVHFTHRGEPVLQSFGNAADNGVRVTLDAQFEIAVTAHVSISTSIEDASFDVPLVARIGLHGAVNVNMYPVLRAADLDLKTTWDGGNVEIVGLDGVAIKYGAILGTAVGFSPLGDLVGGPLSAGVLGAITGQVALDAAKDHAKGLITAKAKAAVESAGAILTTRVDAVIQPRIVQANDILGGIMNKPLPGIGKTLGQLPIGLDVRSVTQQSRLRTAVTTRFRNAIGSGKVSGQLRFPKTACTYVEVNDRKVGHVRFPVGVEVVNADLAGAQCSALHLNELGHDVWYGASPERVLESGDAANALTTWGPLGNAFLEGAVVDTGNAFTCGYRVQDLPDAAIVALGPRAGTALASRFADRAPQSRGRYLLVSQAGVGAMVDHKGTPKDATSLDLGGVGPATIDDCPTIVYSSGTGLQTSLRGRLRDALDPSKCPRCNVVRDPRDRFVLQLRNVGAFLDFARAPVAAPVGPIRTIPNVGNQVIRR